MERMNLKDYINATVTADRISMSLDLVDKNGTVIAANTEPDANLPSKDVWDLIFINHAKNVWSYDVTIIDAYTYDESVFGAFIRENDFFTGEPEFD